MPWHLKKKQDKKCFSNKIDREGWTNESRNNAHYREGWVNEGSDSINLFGEKWRNNNDREGWTATNEGTRILLIGL